MAAEWKSKIPDLQRRMAVAERAALKAAASVLAAEVKQDLADGFTTGAFVGSDPVTGPSMESTVQISNVRKNKRTRFIKVFTDDVRALFWELGHKNPFLRKFVRVPVWRPALERTHQAQAAAYRSVLKAAIGG